MSVKLISAVKLDDIFVSSNNRFGYCHTRKQLHKKAVNTFRSSKSNIWLILTFMLTIILTFKTPHSIRTLIFAMCPSDQLSIIDFFPLCVYMQPQL